MHGGGESVRSWNVSMSLIYLSMYELDVLCLMSSGWFKFRFVLFFLTDGWMDGWVVYSVLGLFSYLFRHLVNARDGDNV